PDVQQDEIWRHVREVANGLLAGGLDGDCVALALERHLHAAGDRRLVLDDHDRGRHGGPSIGRRSGDTIRALWYHRGSHRGLTTLRGHAPRPFEGTEPPPWTWRSPPSRARQPASATGSSDEPGG